MIFTRIGSGVVYNSVPYAVGMRVLANDQSEYEGLFGVITEIRTGNNRETENETPDIECCLDLPAQQDEIVEMGTRFSDLY